MSLPAPEPAALEAAASGFASLPAPTRRLIALRLVRALAQGVWVVDFVLYTRSLGWSAVFIGGVLGVSAILNAGLIVLTGPLSDRMGRKGFIIAYEVAVAIAALVALITPARWPLAAAAIMGGFGRGANGSAGPFGPVEQSWLAGTIPRPRLGEAMSYNVAAGFLGMGVGAFLGGLPDVWGALLPGSLAFRALFLLVLLSVALSLVLILGIPDVRLSPREVPDEAQEIVVRQREHGLLVRLAGLNTLNAVGVSLAGPLVTYWFAKRYGVGPLEIGATLGLSLLVTSISAVVIGKLTRRIGTVQPVVWLNGAGLVLLLLLPFAPTYLIATVIFVLRAACNRGTAGARQALAIGLVRGRRRGLAASVSAASMQIPRAVGPVIAGLLLQSGWLAAPFLLAALFQGGYLFFYPRLFGALDPSFRTRPPAADEP